jgi:hypothetical protein
MVKLLAYAARPRHRRRSTMRRAQLLVGVLTIIALLGLATSNAPAQSVTYTLRSGNVPIGRQDPLVWVQGSPVPQLGFGSSDLPLEHPFVVPTNPLWGDVGGARWVSPSRDGTGAPEGYEYFALFLVPPGRRSARLDVVWRGDDGAGLAVNGTWLPVRLGGFAPSEPPGEFHGDITPLLHLGTNRLQFFDVNARLGINPTGVSFFAQITLTR